MAQDVLICFTVQSYKLTASVVPLYGHIVCDASLFVANVVGTAS